MHTSLWGKATCQRSGLKTSRNLHVPACFQPKWIPEVWRAQEGETDSIEVQMILFDCYSLIPSREISGEQSSARKLSSFPESHEVERFASLYLGWRSLLSCGIAVPRASLLSEWIPCAWVVNQRPCQCSGDGSACTCGVDAPSPPFLAAMSISLMLSASSPGHSGAEPLVPGSPGRGRDREPACLSPYKLWSPLPSRYPAIAFSPF